ncbi:MAG TPA: crotonyl-CoA carboxylase/reductase [Gaiellales bacterium]|jgi:crotonyl-CoA carboxylase/reductase|nr:crotonyl-CoA carboxylase/reductase [Gaiellales bacterium]
MTDVPASMRAWVIRPDRLGEPRDAMRLESVGTPAAGPGEVVVRVMAAGVNYNNVWACLGQPVEVFRYTGDDFHIGGSDASGVVAAVGPGVTRWKIGDEVVVHCNQSCGECPECNGLDPMACSQQKIWAYESNWGSFADYCLVQAQQLLPKPAHLTWAEAASYGLVYFTAYRMLVDQAALEAGHNVLVWGAGGGLGSMAIQLCRLYGANAIAVVSSEDKADLVRRLGAHAVINRRDYALTDAAGEPNLDEVKRFGKAVREATGGVDCDIVFEHVGSATFFTSVFVCRTFGKIVTCGATSGFSLTFDVRYLWMRQKTIIGSHFANAYQAFRANQLIDQRKILPVLSRTFPFEECPEPHQMMRENAHLGKMVVLVGAEA